MGSTTQIAETWLKRQEMRVSENFKILTYNRGKKLCNCLSRVPTPRGEAVREFQKQGYEEWKEDHDYGKRWAVERFFSAVKHCFGETVRVASIDGMVREAKRKFVLYNWAVKM